MILCYRVIPKCSGWERVLERERVPCIGGSLARHKGCPRDHTHGHGVRLAEIDTVLLQLQDVGRPHVHIVVFKVCPSGVIDHNENDVGSLAVQGAAEARPQEEGKQD